MTSSPRPSRSSGEYDLVDVADGRNLAAKKYKREIDATYEECESPAKL
jgi:hypothetical protein